MSSIRKILSVAAVVLFASSGAAFAAGSDSFGADSGEDKVKQAAEAIDKKDYREAISLLEDVLSEDRRNADALNYMGYSHRKLGKFEQAMAYYKRALDVDPTHRGANEYIGQSYLELHQPAKAKAQLEELKRICGTDCEEYVSLKKAYDAYRPPANKS